MSSKGKETPIRFSRQNFLLNKNALIQLQNNDPALTSLTIGIDLDIYDMSRTDGFLPHEDDWGKLGQFIGRNTHLTELKFCGLTGTMFSSETREFDDEAMFGGGTGPNFPRLKQFKDFCTGLANNTSVKKVDFYDTPMLLEENMSNRAAGGGFGMAYILMGDWFKKNTIETLFLPFCHVEDGNYDNSGENRKIATVLAKFSSLKVFRVQFDDSYGGDSPCEVSEQIIDALSHHSELQYVSIEHCNTKWSRGGYAALERFLSGSNALEKLHLEGGMNDEGALVVAAALSGSGNDTLKELLLDDNDDITSAAWEAFAKVLSDSESIMKTYNSNHTIQKLLTDGSSWRDEDWMKKTLGDELFTLLKVNTLCNNKSDAARVKIIMRHLSEDFSMEPFADMDLAALPTALAWMGRTNADIAPIYPNADADLGLMYKFVCSVAAPVIFHPSPLAGKRKAAQQS